MLSKIAWVANTVECKVIKTVGILVQTPKQTFIQHINKKNEKKCWYVFLKQFFVNICGFEKIILTKKTLKSKTKQYKCKFLKEPPSN